MRIKKLFGILAATVLTVSAVACNGNENATTQGTQGSQGAPPTTTASSLSGSLLMVGSTSMENMVNIAMEAFRMKYPDINIGAEYVGSGAGIEAVVAGTSDIGNSSRELKDSEKDAGAVENIVAIDGIAMIVDKANTVSDLSKDQLISIYTGSVKNWSELGGADQPVVVVGREAGSGTRGAFEEILGIVDGCVYSNELDNTGAVVAKVASTPGAIGYVSLDVLDDTVKAVYLDGVEPTADNIVAGTYFLNRPFVMATKGAISEQSEVVQTWFSYLMSAEGTELIKSVGLIPVE